MAVEHRAALADVGDARHGVDHQLVNVRGSGDGLGAGLCGQVAHVDVGNAHHIAPVAHRQAALPLPHISVGAEACGRGLRVEGINLAQVLVRQTGLGALGIDAGHGVFTPHHQPQRSVVGASATAVDHVHRVSNCWVQRVVTWGEAGEALRRHIGVAVEQRVHEVLGHALDMRLGFRQTEWGGVAIEHGHIFVDLAARFQNAHRVGDLCASALAGLNAVVQLAPGARRQAGANRGLVAGRQVAFLPQNVIQRIIVLAQQLNDRGNRAVRPDALGEISQCDRAGLGWESCHVKGSKVDKQSLDRAARNLWRIYNTRCAKATLQKRQSPRVAGLWLSLC